MGVLDVYCAYFVECTGSTNPASVARLHVSEFYKSRQQKLRKFSKFDTPELTKRTEHDIY